MSSSSGTAALRPSRFTRASLVLSVSICGLCMDGRGLPAGAVRAPVWRGGLWRGPPRSYAVSSVPDPLPDGKALVDARSSVDARNVKTFQISWQWHAPYRKTNKLRIKINIRRCSRRAPAAARSAIDTQEARVTDSKGVSLSLCPCRGGGATHRAPFQCWARPQDSSAKQSGKRHPARKVGGAHVL